MKQRSAKKIRKWKEKFERERELRQEIRAAAPDILRSKNFRSTRSHVQHGNMTVNDHSMNVAKYSLAISEKLHIPCEKKELIRGALLHDYFLYDWHTQLRRGQFLCLRLYSLPGILPLQRIPRSPGRMYPEQVSTRIEQQKIFHRKTVGEMYH